VDLTAAAAAAATATSATATTLSAGLRSSPLLDHRTGRLPPRCPDGEVCGLSPHTSIDAGSIVCLPGRAVERFHNKSDRNVVTQNKQIRRNVSRVIKKLTKAATRKNRGTTLMLTSSSSSLMSSNSSLSDDTSLQLRQRSMSLSECTEYSQENNDLDNEEEQPRLKFARTESYCSDSSPATSLPATPASVALSFEQDSLLSPTPPIAVRMPELFLYSDLRLPTCCSCSPFRFCLCQSHPSSSCLDNRALSFILDYDHDFDHECVLALFEGENDLF
jgi:hypothetical protein